MTAPTLPAVAAPQGGVHRLGAALRRFRPRGRCGGTRCVLPVAKLRSNSHRKSEVEAGCARTAPCLRFSAAPTSPAGPPDPTAPTQRVALRRCGGFQGKNGSVAFSKSVSSYLIESVCPARRVVLRGRCLGRCNAGLWFAAHSTACGDFTF